MQKSTNNNKVGSKIQLTWTFIKKITITMHGKIGNCPCCYSANRFILISSKKHQQGRKATSFNNTFLIHLCILYWNKLFNKIFIYYRTKKANFFGRLEYACNRGGAVKKRNVVWWATALQQHSSPQQTNKKFIFLTK